MTIKYVFSINAGRSGSDYLTQLLKQTQNAVSLHEALPIMCGPPMQQFNQGDERALQALMPHKLKQIKQDGRNGQTIYCETNHTFIKGWGYLLPDRYIPQEEIGVIILRRDEDATVRSLLRVRDVPGVSAWSREWYLTPDSSRNLVPPPTGRSPESLCRWYLRETDARAEAYQAQFPNITYFECDLSELNDGRFVTYMFGRFDIMPIRALGKHIGRPINKRDEWPAQSLAELTTPSPYPNPDHLPPNERDELLTEMITYIRRHKKRNMRWLKPERNLGGSYSLAVIKLLARHQTELEQTFQYQIRYTEFEWTLIWEFLYTINPHDLSFVAVTRHGPPNIHYGYQFNQRWSLQHLWRNYSLREIYQLGQAFLRGMWGRDLSHFGE